MKFIILSLLVFIQAVFLKNPDETNFNILKERVFKGEALYGFMNGGSDLYLEYGFRELRVMELIYKGNVYSVELYDMGNPESAFGIYSQNAFKCNPYDKFFRCDCTSSKQYQAIKGNFYMSVVYENNTDENRVGAYYLAEYFFNKYEAHGDFLLPESISNYLIPGYKLSEMLKYSCGPISLSNSISSRMYLFEELESYKVWLLQKEDDSKIADIRFKSIKDAQNFLERVKENEEGLKREIIDSLNITLTILPGF